MTEQDEADARELMVMGLSGAKFTAKFYERNDARAAVQKLMQCHEHHFAVVCEGLCVVMSHLAMECLRRAKLLPVERVWVYEGTGHGE